MILTIHYRTKSRVLDPKLISWRDFQKPFAEADSCKLVSDLCWPTFWSHPTHPLMSHDSTHSCHMTAPTWCSPSCSKSCLPWESMSSSHPCSCDTRSTQGKRCASRGRVTHTDDICPRLASCTHSRAWDCLESSCQSDLILQKRGKRW